MARGLRGALLAGALVAAASPALASTVPVPEPGGVSLVGAALLGGVLALRLLRRR